MNFLTILIIVNILVFIYAKKELKDVRNDLHEVMGELEETKNVNREIYKWNRKIVKESKELKDKIIAQASTMESGKNESKDDIRG